MLLSPSRFPIWSKNAVIALIALLMLIIIAGYASLANVSAMKPDYNDNTGPMSEQAQGQGGEIVDDQALYAHIADRMRAGDGYYQAAADEHRASGYPLKPFVTVRLPTLAMLHVMLGQTVMRVLAGILAIFTAYAWYKRFKQDAPNISPRIGTMLIFIGMVPLFWPKWLYTHDVWAGALVALGIALYRPQKPWAALALLFAALFIRETVLPIILLAGAFALFQKRWREVAFIAVGCGIFTIVLFLHAQAVTAIVKPDDLASPGWVKAGGVATWLLFLQETSFLRNIPAITPIIAPLAIFGFLGWRNNIGLFLFFIHMGYAILFMAIGRADNFYWGFLVTPTLLVGLAFIPRLIADARERWTEAPLSG